MTMKQECKAICLGTFGNSDKMMGGECVLKLNARKERMLAQY